MRSPQENPEAKQTSGVILITGASGFVGGALCRTFEGSDTLLRAAIRALPAAALGVETVAVGELGADTQWEAALRGIDTVIHLAGRAHVMHDTAGDALAVYRSVNVAGTRALAQAAVKAGVRRLVFVSSIKVNGERTDGRPFTENDAPQPEDAYGISKYEAEQALLAVAAHGELEVVILRAPLIYGPGVKGNFLSLLEAVARGTWLPLASIDNRRSLLYVGNLVSAIIQCVDAPTAAQQTFLVADDMGVATPELIRAVGIAFEQHARLLPCPPALLRAGGALLGKSAMVARLTGSLQIDSSKIRQTLNWQPPTTLAQGLAETARWYHARTAAGPIPK
jgi:nucleoside-diphosphate-sugar epimerase